MKSNSDNFQFPNSTKILCNSMLNDFIRHDFKKLLILNIIIIIFSILSLIARIITNVIDAHNDKVDDNKLSYFIFEIIVISISIINGIIGIILIIYERKQLNIIHIILNIILSILFSLVFIIEFIRWCIKLLNENQLLNSIRLIIILFTLIILICQIGCIINNRILNWTPKYRYSRFLLCFSSIIQLSISIASIIFNKRVHNLTDNIPKWCYILFTVSSIYTLICGLIGICLTFIYGRKINKFEKSLRYLFNIYCIIGLLLIIIFTILLLSYNIKINDKINLNILKHSRIYLSIVQCILIILSIRSLYNLSKLRKSIKNNLIIERIHLNEISSIYIKHWSISIDKYNSLAEGMTGEGALQLMKAYENGQMENIECIVLRIRRINKLIPISLNELDDTEAIVLLTIIHNYDIIYASHFNGFWGKFLQRTLGSQNSIKSFRPALLRVGLIGFQWPFRISIFYTNSNDNSFIRDIHILKTIIDWNEMQKSNIQCDLLLLPSLTTESISKSILFAGLFPINLPPTHLLDLRLHKGKTWNQYMKTLKKGNRRPYIQQFLNKGGIIQEINDLTKPEIGEMICKQFNNIAKIRYENKEPPTLVKPSPQFISSMGYYMNQSYRSVLFLIFNNEIIASSIIYKFPNKLLTTDIQGLTHEKARPLKAYFVMLQWITKYALDNQYDFIDFGPTTSGPKIDLGAISIPLQAGGYTSNPILAFAIQQAGHMVNHIHNQQQSTNNHHQQSNTNMQIDTNNITSQQISNKQKQKQKQLKNNEKQINIDVLQEHDQNNSIINKDNHMKTKNYSENNINEEEQSTTLSSKINSYEVFFK